MFIGHIATALAAKKIDAQTSLGAYVLAASAPDVLFSLLLLGNVETVEIAPGHTAMVPMAFPNYPYSHSLVGAAIAGLLMGGLYWAWKRRVRAAVILLGLSLGHWLLDVISHAPDVPVGLSGPYLGLGLWSSVSATFAVEGILFIIGALLYLRATNAKDRIGRWGFSGFILFLTLAYSSGPFSPPPPSAITVAIVNNVSIWLMIVWAAWFDRHREPRAPTTLARII